MYCIYLHKDWPDFKWDNQYLMPLLGMVRNAQGVLTGKMASLGFDFKNEALLTSLSEEVLKTSEIEGDNLDKEQVRSSVARRLGMDIAGLINSDRNVDGVVEMLFDATQNCNKALLESRLFGWHSSLFPTGWSGLYKIEVGSWRKDSTGPMQVLSGSLSKQKVHFKAPNSEVLEKEMKLFLNWLNEEDDMDLVFKSGVAHLWFVTIHPFEDGNGRIGRAIADMFLSRSEHLKNRYYSMSAQIRKDRKEYYKMLQATQSGDMDITKWMEWYLNCLLKAIKNSEKTVEKVLVKHQFWLRYRDINFNERQRKMLNRLLIDFKVKLTSSKWAKMNKCSNDTALRDIQDLIRKKILMKEPAGGRSTNYELIKELQ